VNPGSAEKMRAARAMSRKRVEGVVVIVVRMSPDV
jgi:hypothetical protein